MNLRVKSVLLSLVLATSLYGESVSSLDIGLGAVDMKSQTSRDNLYMNYSWMSGKEDVVIGIGLDILTYRVGSENAIPYVLSPQISIGYGYKNFLLKASVGYGVHRISDRNYHGLSYDLSISSIIYKSLGVGYKHKEFYSSYESGLNHGSADIFYMKLQF